MNKLVEELKNLNLYEILEIQQSATEKEVKTAYRKKALLYHPDKNPNNPKAAQLFLRLSKILDVLTDKSARAYYDKLLNGKRASESREKEYDAKRKKYDDFHRKEQYTFRFDRPEYYERYDESNTQNWQEVPRKSELIAEKLRLDNFNLLIHGSFKLKVKWEKSIPHYGENNLKFFFSMYGTVISVEMLENKFVAFIEYECKLSAILAQKRIVGYRNNPLTISLIEDDEDTKKSGTDNQSIETSTSQTFMDNETKIQEQFRQAGTSQEEKSTK